MSSDCGLLDASKALRQLQERGERLVAACSRFGITERFQEGRELLPALLATRIGLLGTMNLYLPAAGRYLRDLGLSVEIRPYAGQKEDNFRLEADHIRPDDVLPSRDLAWNDIITPTPDDLLRSIGPYGFVIGNGQAPAFFARMGRSLDLFLPYGSDLYEMPFLWTREDDFDKRRDLNRLALGHYQRIGIRQARHVQISNPESRPHLETLDQPRFTQRGVPMLYAPSYDSLTDTEAWSMGNLTRQVADLKSRFSFLVCHHSRHYWKTTTSPISQKGNDVLLRGFAAFSKTTEGQRACLVTFNYGPDVEASRQLISELGIQDRVLWLPKAMRKEIMSILRLCDVATGEFKIGWCFSGVIYEAIIAGKPLINHGLWNQHTEWPSRPYPYLQASDETEIRDALSSVATAPALHRARAAEARIWYDEVVVAPFLGDVLKQFYNTVQSRRAHAIHGDFGPDRLQPSHIPLTADQQWQAARRWAVNFPAQSDEVRNQLQDFILKSAAEAQNSAWTDSATPGTAGDKQ